MKDYSLKMWKLGLKVGDVIEGLLSRCMSKGVFQFLSAISALSYQLP